MTTPTTNQNAALKSCEHYHDPTDIQSVCENCHLVLCGDCEVLSGICSCCGGSICENCKVNARQRQKIEGNRSVTEYLCKGCAEKQDKAIAVLNNSIFGAPLNRVKTARKWLAEGAEAASSARQKADAFASSQSSTPDKYAMIAGWMESASKEAARQMVFTSEWLNDLNLTLNPYPERKLWLSDIISDLEELISEAKEAL